MRAEGEIALVTGAGSGLGKATASRLASLGAKVICVDRAPEAAIAAAREVQGEPVVCDISDGAIVERAFGDAFARVGVPRIVVNCAGVSLPKRIVGRDGILSIAAFETSLRVNTLGSYIVLSHATRAMRELEPRDDGERGVIVMTASVAAEEGQIGQCGYSASKAGVVAMTLPAARELARYGIRVLSISPGLFDTPMMSALPPDAQTALNALTLFPARLGRSDEFASLVQHIVENRMLNGEHIRLDGGIRLPPK